MADNTSNLVSQDARESVNKGEPQSNVALDPKKPSDKDILTEFGGTGTIIVGGILSSTDYNLDLSGTQRVDIYDQMRKGDATVRAALLAVKLPILSAQWYIEPASEDDKDKEIADWIEDQLMNKMELSWTDWLRQALLFLDYGSMVFEKVYKITEDGKIGIEKLAPRLTKTIYRWRMLDNKTKGITQILPTGGMREIPEWKLLMLVNEQEGENYEGISILRSCYKSWYMKDAYYKIDGIATERQGLGIPYVKIPPNATDQDRAKVDELMRNLRTNEQANIQIPVGWEVGFLDMKAGQIKQSKDMILHHDRQITKSVLAQFIELGGTNAAGAKAVADPMMDLFLSSELATSRKIKEQVNECVIKDLVNLNFGEQEKYPRLSHGEITNIDIDKLSTALSQLSGVNMITATPKIEQYLRQAMKLPDEDPDEIEKIKLEKQQQAIDHQAELASLGGGGGPNNQPDNKNNFGKNNFDKKLTNSEMRAMENRINGKLRMAKEEMTADAKELKEEIEGVLHGRGIKRY